MSKLLKKISTEGLIQMFLNYKKEITFSGVTFANITYFVDESGSKTVDKKKVLQKMVTRQIVLGASYQDKVNRIIQKENEDREKSEKSGVAFVSQAMTGKQYVQADNRFVAETIKTGQKLLCFIGDVHVTPKTTYFHEGKKISRAEARTEKYFTPAGLNPKRADMGGISDENKFYFNTVYFSNIVAITMNKTRYVIED